MGRKPTPLPSPRASQGDVSKKPCCSQVGGSKSKNRPAEKEVKKKDTAPDIPASTSAPAPSSGRAVQPSSETEVPLATSPDSEGKPKKKLKDVKKKKKDTKMEERLSSPMVKQKPKTTPKMEEAGTQFGNDFPHLFLVKTPMK